MVDSRVVSTSSRTPSPYRLVRTPAPPPRRLVPDEQQAQVLAHGAGPLLVFTAFFAAGPVVALGLLMTGTVRAWFAPPSQVAQPLAA